MRKRTAKKAISLLLTAAMVLTMLPVMASALTVSTKPNNGTATGEPFPKGTGGSNSFRIPAMVTLSDGTIVAAADARWNTTYDGGGLDTIVARSSDNGESWSYTFANYLGDNGNVNNASSTAFIDPALAVKTINGVETIFMLVDLYPYGVALNGGPEIYPVTTKGFNDKGKLRLSGDNHSNYGYYLDGTVIKDSADNVVSGLTVDAYFNVSGTYNGTSYDTNLFFSDSPFKVVRTGFLYLTTSTDKGATWSAPTLLDLKTSSERVCLVGPGRGLVTSDGTIVFPVYSYYADDVPTGAGLTQYTGFIYSTDGVNWSRSANFTGASWSSEAAVVELDDGTLRFFYRNGTTNLCYVDYSNGSWGSYVNTGLDTNSNCQISAITYSKTVNDKQVILVSCPAGPNNAGSDQSGASYRKNGKIFIGLVNADKTMSWQTDNTISVPSVNSSDSFMYSCLTEQKDNNGNETGVISILYEDNENAWGTGSNCYYEMSFKTYTSTDLGVTFDSTTSGGDTETGSTELADEKTGVTVTTAQAVLTSVSVSAGNATTNSNGTVSKTWSISVNNGAYTGAATVKIPYDSAFDGCTSFSGYMDDGADANDAVTVTLKDGYFVCDVLHFSNLTITGSSSATQNVTLKVGETYTVTDETGNYEDVTTNVEPNANVATMNVSGENATSATGKLLSTNGEVDLSDCLFTFTLETGSCYTVESANNPGHYLNNIGSGSAKIPIATTQSTVEIVAGNYTNMFRFKSQAVSGYNYDGTPTLHFHTELYTPYWNRCGTDNSIKCEEYIYRPAKVGETASTEIPGYVLVKEIGDIVSGEKYLIAHTNGTNYYVLYPGTTQYGCVVQVNADSTTTTASTEITFTGVAPGTTTAKVGNTTYNITVSKKTETAGVAVGGSITISGAGNTIERNSKESVATATISEGTLTVTGVAEGTAVITTDYGVYTITVYDGTPISIKDGETSKIEVTLNGGQYVEWTTSDGSYVGVAGVYDSANSAYTDAAIIAGQNVTTSPVLVTGTVYNENGTVAGVYKWLVTVTENTASSDMRTVTIKFDIAYLRNCTVYYSINAGPLTEIKLADLYTTTDSDGNTYYYFDAVVSGSYTNSGHGVNVSFFAKPNEGYALTYMAYTSSQALTYDYYTISDGNPDGSGSEAWPFDDEHQSTVPTSQADAAWKNNSSGNCTGYGWALLQGNMTLDQWKLMMSNAIALGCDGVQLFTKNNANETFEADLYFVSQKLPEMTKEVTFVGGEPYNPDAGTKVEIGDTIVYKITVYEPVADENYGTITYSDINIQDPLTGDSWTTKGTAGTETTVTINGHTFTAIPYTYTTYLTLTTQNFTDVVNAGTITNTVTFSYLANSTYTSGSVSVAAQAGIHVSVDPSYVVDFGVPLNIDLTELVDAYGLISKIEDPAGNEVSISNNKLHINTTDARSFTDIMAYKVTLTDNGAYYITIIPASNVLFEAETFMTASGSGAAWTTTGSATVTEQDGSETDPYGYDGKYAGQTAGAYSAGLACTASVSSSVRTTQDLTFSFTGTGFDLIGTCGPKTGTLLVRVDNKNGWYKSYMVDTSFEDDNYGTISQVPLIHAQDWPEGTYTVTIRGVYMGGDAVFGIDAFRVYRSTAEQAYNDAERNAKYYNVLNEKILDKNTIQAYTEKSTGTTTEWEVTEYEANGGPQNEIYLAAGQAVAFKVENSADVYDTHNPLVHFSARALNGTSVSISTKGKTFRVGTVASGTEMYYAVTASNDGIITITNTNASGMLALGNLKLTAVLSDGTSDDGKTGVGADASSPFSLLLSRSSSETSGVIYVGQAATLVPLTEDDQETVNALLSLNSSGDSENTDPDTGDADVNDSDSSGSTGSTGDDDVVILPTPDTSFDAEDEPEDETTDGPQSPYLNKGEAYAYITGFADGTVRPMAEITRAEVATIFYRMLKDEIRDRYWSNTNDFTDVTSGDWYNTAVSTLASLGIVTGNPDGSFNPNGKITRAEFATMAVRFFVVTEEYDLDETVFSDISTSWAAKNILLAYELGLVNGNPDGTFRPGNSITRAESMTIVNNMLGRKPKVAGLPDEADMITWVDNADKSVWYYAGVQAATNSYTSVYSEEIGGDLWTGVTTVPNWSELEKIWAGKHTED